MNIFISHNSKDKPLIEPIANHLADTFGRENVFYDSWSIQPGDDILDKMGEGLEQADIFFFFMSPNSLASNMVKIEWQNALFKKVTQNNVKFIPVLIADVKIPSLIAQKIYIDILNQGLDVGVRQMVDVIKGSNNYQSSIQSVDNLVQEFQFAGNKLSIKITAKFYMEPLSHFLIVLPDSDIKYDVPGEVELETNLWSKETSPFSINSPQNFYVHYLRVERPITVGFPLNVNITLPRTYTIDNSEEFIYSLFHRKSERDWEIVPAK